MFCMLALRASAHCVHLCQAWQYVSSQVHLRICLQIAGEARAEKRNPMLAQIYDELCRKAWAECAFRGDQGFDIDVVSRSKDFDILSRARIIWDEKSPGQPNVTKAANPPAKNNRKGGGGKGQQKGDPVSCL